MRDLLARIAGRAVERPTPVIFAAVLLTLIGAVAALRLQADRSPDSLVDRGSGTYAATQRFYEEFGDEPVEILVKGELRQLLAHRQPRALAGAGELPLGQGARRAGGQRRARAARLCGDLPPRPERGRLRPGDLSRTSSRFRRTSCSPSSSRRRCARAQQAAIEAARQAKKAGLSAAEQQRAGAGGVPGGAGQVRAAGPGPRCRVRPDGPAEAHQPGLRLVGDLRRRGSPAACRRPGSRRSSPAPTRP